MPNYVFSLNGKRVTAIEKKTYVIDGREYSQQEFLTLYNGQRP